MAQATTVTINKVTPTLVFEGAGNIILNGQP